MKRLFSLLIVIALIVTFMAMSTGVASANAPEKGTMLLLHPPGWSESTQAMEIVMPVAAEHVETAADHSLALVYAGP